MPLFFISDPMSIIKSVFKVMVLSKSMFLSIHPLSIIDFFLLQERVGWFPQQDSSSMLKSLLKLPTILHILSVKSINPIALNLIHIPSAYINISIAKSILSLLQMHIILPIPFLIIGLILLLILMILRVIDEVIMVLIRNYSGHDLVVVWLKFFYVVGMVLDVFWLGASRLNVSGLLPFTFYAVRYGLLS